jgi:hypothetical protein
MKSTRWAALGCVHDGTLGRYAMLQSQAAQDAPQLAKPTSMGTGHDMQAVVCTQTPPLSHHRQLYAVYGLHSCRAGSLLLQVIRMLIAEETPRHVTQKQIDAVEKDIAAIQAESKRLHQIMEVRYTTPVAHHRSLQGTAGAGFRDHHWATAPRRPCACPLPRGRAV